MATSSSSGKCCSTSQEEFTTWRHLLSKEKNCLKGWQTSLETQKKTASQALFSSHISLPFFLLLVFELSLLQGNSKSLAAVLYKTVT